MAGPAAMPNAPSLRPNDFLETGKADRPLTIGEVAREFGMTLRALRFYEAKRLISPQRNGPTRLYHRGDRERIALILTGRRLGFTLAEVKRLLDGPDGKNLHLTRDKCVEQINLLERQKRGIELALGELRQIYTSFYRTLVADDASAHAATDCALIRPRSNRRPQPIQRRS